MDYTKNESAYEIYNREKPEEETFAERVEDFFIDHGATLISVGTWAALSALTIFSMIMVKKAAKNGLTVNVISPFLVKVK